MRLPFSLVVPMLLVQHLSAQVPNEGSAPNEEAPKQKAPDDRPVRLPELVITPTASARAPMDVPFAEDVVTEERILRRSYRTTPSILRDIPGVFVQETAVGHGSPYIRGFTSFRNLFLIDGIRLNNSVFRPGPNQYWNTVDPFTIEQMEVVKGPGSVLYGSDAIGGTINARTRRPYLSKDGSNIGGRISYRYSTAENSNIGRAELSALGDNGTGVLMGVGFKSFGDLRAGGATGTQPETGYEEIDGDMKLEGYIDPKTRWTVGFQHVAQNDVPRTHKTVFAVPFEGTSVGSDLRRDLDQRRTLGYTQLHGEDLNGFFDSYNLSLSWQQQEETRHRTRSNGNREEQGFDVGQLGLLANFSSQTSVGRLTYGLDYYRDFVDSFSSKEPIQGPIADDSTYDLFGLFLQDEIEATDKLSFILGARYNYAAVSAGSVLDPVTDTQTTLDDQWGALVGSARFLYQLQADVLHLFGGVSQGFRAPNLSDLTRFDSARSNEFEIPSPGLDPEFYTNYEIGVKGQAKRSSLQVALFYTEIRDQIVRFPTGNTNSAGEFEITKANVGDGYVYGVEFGGAYELAPAWTVFGNAAYQYGEVDTFPTSAQVLTRETISRLMPFRAQLGVGWDDPEKGRWVEAQVVYSATADKLNTRDQSDSSRIPAGGTPSYLLAHVRGGVDLNENVSLNIGVENVGDVNYRVHGSGQNSAGLNFIAGLSVSF